MPSSNIIPDDNPDLTLSVDPDLTIVADAFTFNNIEHPSLQHLYDLLAYLEKNKDKFKVVWSVIERMFDSRLNVTVTNDDIGAIAEELKVSFISSYFICGMHVYKLILSSQF